MKVLVVGSGGREHALAVALARGDHEVWVAPGNPGMAHRPGIERGWGGCLGAEDPLRAARRVGAALVVVGPEQPLAAGLADELRGAGLAVLGPGAAGARLESSKVWMKELCAAVGVPTARWAAFDRTDEALEHLRRHPGPYVVKADGLAAGKGVLVTDSLAEAEADVVAKLSGAALGAAGRRVVLEEAMRGPELSVLALCDGERAVLLPPARDAKRLGDGDVGPNTGGMGAFAPVPGVDAAMLARVRHEILEPVLGELRRRGVDYRGILYAGLMLTTTGPRLVEFNVRLGDPEAQVVLPLVPPGALGSLLLAAARGGLDEEAAERALSPASLPEPAAAVCVVLAAPGYPEHPRHGLAVRGVEGAASLPGVTVLQAGTAVEGGELVSAGGRVLDVVGTGPSLAVARARTYEAVAAIDWPEAQFRRDIAAVPGLGEPRVAAAPPGEDARPAEGARAASAGRPGGRGDR